MKNNFIINVNMLINFMNKLWLFLLLIEYVMKIIFIIKINMLIIKYILSFFFMNMFWKLVLLLM